MLSCNKGVNGVSWVIDIGGVELRKGWTGLVFFFLLVLVRSLIRFSAHI